MQSKWELTASLQQRIIAAVKLTTGQESLAGSRSCRCWNSRGQRMMGRCRRIPRWRPTCCLSVKHSQLIVDTLRTLMRLHRGRLLLLLRGQVPEYPVNGRHLRRKRNFRWESIIRIIYWFNPKSEKNCKISMMFFIELLLYWNFFIKIINKFKSIINLFLIFLK